MLSASPLPRTRCASRCASARITVRSRSALAQTVRANADRERTVILAEAQRDAQRVRGNGDAESIRIYADAFGQDKEFFAFYRSMQAYRDALNGRTTSFVLTPDTGFFRFFESVDGALANPPPPTAKAGSP